MTSLCFMPLRQIHAGTPLINVSEVEDTADGDSHAAPAVEVAFHAPTPSEHHRNLYRDAPVHFVPVGTDGSPPGGCSTCPTQPARLRYGVVA